MDALSEVLSAIRLDGAVYINAEFTAPWCVETQYGLHSAASGLPDSDHIVYFHLLTEGTCLARLVGGSEVVEVKPHRPGLGRAGGHSLGGDSC